MSIPGALTAMMVTGGAPAGTAGDTGWVIAGTGGVSGTGDNWVTPGNITTEDTSYAVCAGTAGASDSEYLEATNFGLSLPAGATIDGVEVRIRGLETEAGFGSEGTIVVVQLIKGGTVSGNDLEAGATAITPTFELDYDYGSASEMWGLTLTKTDVEASNFGFAMKVNVNGSQTSSIDIMEIKVHYTP